MMTLPQKLFSLVAGVCLLPSVANAAPQLVSPPTTQSIQAEGGVVTFMFSEPMNTSGVDIAWEGVDGSKFEYEWRDEILGFPVPPVTLECSYAGGLPGGTEVSFTLNPGGSGVIQSQAGEALPETSGTFQTPGTSTGGNGGGGDGCEGIVPGQNTSAALMLKQVNYWQESEADPEFDAEKKAVANAAVFNTTNATSEVTAATLVKPDGSSVELTEIGFDAPDVGFPLPEFPSNFFLSTGEPPEVVLPIFESEAAINAAFPDGLYTMNVDLAGGGSASIPLSLDPQTAPPKPKCLNYAELQGLDASQPVTIAWNAFTGAGSSDGVSITVRNEEGQVVFKAPDKCAEPPVELAPTDTAVTLPADLLEADQRYEVELTFFKITHTGDGTVEGMNEFAAHSKTTRFEIGAPAESGDTRLEFAGIEVQGNGDVRLLVGGTLSAQHSGATIQRSTNLETWSDVETVANDVLGTVTSPTEVIDTSAGVETTGQAYYRIQGAE